MKSFPADQDLPAAAPFVACFSLRAAACRNEVTGSYACRQIDTHTHTCKPRQKKDIKTWCTRIWPIGRPPAPGVSFNHQPLGFLSLVILLDSKAQQTELEWISYPPNGVSLQNPCIAHMHSSGCPLHFDVFSLTPFSAV